MWLRIKKNFKLAYLLVPGISLLIYGCAEAPTSIDNNPEPLAISSTQQSTSRMSPSTEAQQNPIVATNGAALSQKALATASVPEAEAQAAKIQLEPVESPVIVNGQLGSLWDVIRAGFSINHYYNNPDVQYYVQMYTKDPSLIQNITTQATPYLYTIVSMLQQKGLPTELALLPIVESGFRPHARSYCGALGIWQLMPAAAKRFNASEENYWYNSRESIDTSTNAALDYLKYLYNYFNGDWLLAIAAYNSGEGTVQNAMDRNEQQGLPTDFWSLKLPAATESYVPEFLALAIIVNDPSHYGVALPPIPNKPLTNKAPIPKQMTLSQAAKFAGIDESELKALNPAFVHDVTPPASKGQYSLNLPVNKVAAFEQNCAANPEATGFERYYYATYSKSNSGSYTVRKGDTLASVSRFTGASISTLKQYNHLKTANIKTGQVLKYPIDKTSAYTYLTYSVKAGDSLSSIARHYHVSLFNLMQWNNLTSNKALHTGQRLVIRQKIRY